MARRATDHWSMSEPEMHFGRDVDVIGGDVVEGVVVLADVVDVVGADWFALLLHPVNASTPVATANAAATFTRVRPALSRRRQYLCGSAVHQ
jgi:hypothetical protein